MMSKALPIGTLLRPQSTTREQLRHLRAAGLETCQIARIGEEFLSGDGGRRRTWQYLGLLAEHGLTPVSLFVSFPSLDFAKGLVTEKSRASRMLLACRQMNWARRLGITYITCHVGDISQATGEMYEQLIHDFQQLLCFAEENGQYWLFETGPEPVASLKKTFADIGSPNLGLNFDPANLLIYDRDDPQVMVDELGDRVKVVHCKDAVRPTEPGKMGRETVLGQGGTAFASILTTLMQRGFRGPLVIERELPPGPEQQKDVAEAIGFLKQLRKPFLEKP